MAVQPPNDQSDPAPSAPGELPEEPPYKYEPTYQPGPYPAGPYPYGYQPYKDAPPRRRGIGRLGITVILLALMLTGLIAAFYLGLFTPAAI